MALGSHWFLFLLNVHTCVGLSTLHAAQLCWLRHMASCEGLRKAMTMAL